MRYELSIRKSSKQFWEVIGEYDFFYEAEDEGHRCEDEGYMFQIYDCVSDKPVRGLEVRA